MEVDGFFGSHVYKIHYARIHSACITLYRRISSVRWGRKESRLGLDEPVAEPDLPVGAVGEPFVVGDQGNGQAVAFPEIEEQVAAYVTKLESEIGVTINQNAFAVATGATSSQ